MAILFTMWHDMATLRRCNFFPETRSYLNRKSNIAVDPDSNTMTSMDRHQKTSRIASSCQHSTTAGRYRQLRTVLYGVTALLALGLTPVAAQQPVPVTADSNTASSDAVARTGPVLLDWIPAISIQSSEIDLLLDEQNQSGNFAAGMLPAAGLNKGGASRLMSSSQLVLRLLPEPGNIDRIGNGGSIGNRASYSWSLLGNSTDQPAGLRMRSSRPDSFTGLGGSLLGSAVQMPQAESFTPQLNLGWQLGLQGDAANAAGTPYALGANPRRNTATGSTTLASIQCAESVLTSSSYSASGCRFTQINQQQMLVGLDWQPLPGLSTSAGIFESSQTALPGWQQYSIGAGNLAAASFGNASMGDLLAGASQQIRGMQLGMQLELLSGNNNIDISAGWSRITDFELDAPFLDAAVGSNAMLNQGSMLQTLGLTNLSAVNAFNRGGRFVSNETLDAASLQINWTNGAFSSGLESVYQQTPLLPGIARGDDLTTFNLHFTWHTPWRGALSVGANNVLDTTGNGNVELTGEDALNSIYGRIPYVRYKQDL